MSCYGCTKKYGLFCKEYGCPNCGYSYCAKCLTRPVAVPRHENKVMNVCLICFDKLLKLNTSANIIDCGSSPSSSDRSNRLGAAGILDLDDVPPDLGNVLAPITPTDASKTGEINENLDSVISKRLKDLKSDNALLPSDDELRSRLSDLSGMPMKNYSKKDLLSTDSRSDQEKINDLIQQFAGECELDQQTRNEEREDPISEIERRLAALRDGDASALGATSKTVPDLNTPSDNELDDETMLKTIMEKYLSEVRLPPTENDLGSESAQLESAAKPNNIPTEELPWCNICNENAVTRCIGCDGELFCDSCFRECHDDDEEYRNHVTEKYNCPPHFKEDHF